jgi:putative transposase
MDPQPGPRKRMRRWEIDGQIRFVTFSCERRLPLLRNPAIADLMVASIAQARAAFEFSLFAWVVMPEHVHLLVRPATAQPLGPALRSLKTSVARRVLARWRRLGAPILAELQSEDGSLRFWLKGGGFDRNVRDEAEFRRAVQYIHRNPVERELVELPEDWRWSSVFWWAGQRDGLCDCDPPPGDARLWSGWEGYR